MDNGSLPVIQIPVDNSNLEAAISHFEKLEAMAEKYAKFKVGGSAGSPAGGAGNPGGPGNGGASNFQKNANKVVKDMEKSFKEVNKTLATTTGKLKELFEGTIKWGARIALLTIGGGAFGFNALNKSTATNAMEAQALRLTSGQVKAANNVYGNRIGGIEGILNALARGGGDQNSKEAQFVRAINLDPSKGASNLPAVLQRISSLDYMQAQSYGIESVASLGQYNQIKANKGKLPSLASEYQGQSEMLTLADGIESGAQDVISTFDKNMDRVGVAFTTQVAKLNKPLMDLSNTFTDAVTKFLSGPNGEAVFKTISDGLNEFSQWIGSPQFKDDLGEFTKNVGEIAKAIGSAVSWIAGKIGDESTGEGGTSLGDAALVGGGAYLGKMLGGPIGAGWGAYAGYLYADRENIKNSALSSWNYAKSNAGDAMRWTGIDTDFGRNPHAVADNSDVMFDIPGYEKPKVQPKQPTQPFLHAGNDGLFKNKWNTENIPSDSEPVQHAQATRRKRASNPYALIEGKYNLPDGLLSKVQRVESSGNNMAVSGKGAMGPFQFMPKTAAAFGLKGDDVYDPQLAAEAAGKYISQLQKQFGSTREALAAYNWGPGNLDKYGLGKAPKETRDYIEKLGYAGSANQPRVALDVSVKQAPGSDIIAQVSGNSFSFPF